MSDIKPSNPGYNFTTADLQRASFPPDLLGKMIVQAGKNPDAGALLAAILKSQRKQNANFRPASINFPIWSLQSLFSANPNRSYLIIQNTGNGDLMLIFEDGPASIQDNSGSTDAQQQLTNMQTRALRIVAGGYYEPLVPPTNSLTLFTLGVATNGVAIEGQ